jgi:hypothetical protein
MHRFKTWSYVPTMSKTQSARRSLDRLQRLARKRADDQAQRIPWQRLKLEISTSTGRCSTMGSLDPGSGGRHWNWLVEARSARCPGFLEGERAAKVLRMKPLHFRLEDWISDLAEYSLKSARTCGIDVTRNYFLE